MTGNLGTRNCKS